MTPEEIRQKVGAWVSPLAGESAVGVDSRHDPEFAELRVEVSKLEALTSGSVVWDRVVELGGSILENRSKDILVAAYLAHALGQLEGLQGLSGGLTLVTGLIDSYWEQCFPSRLKARVNALQWYLQRAAEKLAAIEIAGADGGRLAELVEAARNLLDVIRHRVGEAPPGTGLLRRELERLAVTLAGEAVTPATEPQRRGSLAEGTKPEGISQAPEASGSPMRGAAADVSSAAVADLGDARERLQAAQSGLQGASVSLVELAGPWLAPISAETPEGVDARYEPGHEAIRSEVAKWGSVSGGEVDWALVVEEGDRLLKERSKDLLIAAYVAWGLQVREGLLGLGTGIALVCGLIDQYWDSLFPVVRRNTRARANAITWLLEKAESLGEMELGTGDQAAVDVLETGASRLGELVAERFDEGHRPSVHLLNSLVRRLKLSLQQQAAGSVEPSPASGSGTSAGKVGEPNEKAGDSGKAEERTKPADIGGPPQVPAAPADGFDEGVVDAFLSELRSTLLHVADGLRRAEPASAIGFRLGRMATFLRTTEAPEADSSGRTIAPPPPDDALQYLQQLLTEKNWPELLAESEDLLARYAFSLDCYRYACIALENLGADYATAHRVVMGELAALLCRVPELPDLCFSDGTPFAGDVTRAWIRTAVGGAGGVTQAASPASGGGSAEPLAVLEQARQAVGRGDAEGALASLQAAVNQASGGRERFRLRLALAETCAEAGAAKVAEGMYATLVEEIRDRGLEDWEPELASQCLVSYYRLLSGLSAKNEDIAEKLSMMYRRLCRLDPRWALEQSR